MEDWTTIMVNAYGDMRALRTALANTGSKIDNRTKSKILGHILSASEPEDVRIVCLSVDALGFSKGATRCCLYERAQRLGLSLLSADTGPRLRLQYLEQPFGEWILIGMKPVYFDGKPKVFGIGHDRQGLQLSLFTGSHNSLWQGSDLWVFGCNE